MLRGLAFGLFSGLSVSACSSSTTNAGGAGGAGGSVATGGAGDAGDAGGADGAAGAGGTAGEGGAAGLGGAAGSGPCEGNPACFVCCANADNAAFEAFKAKLKFFVCTNSPCQQDCIDLCKVDDLTPSCRTCVEEGGNVVDDVAADCNVNGPPGCKKFVGCYDACKK